MFQIVLLTVMDDVAYFFRRALYILIHTFFFFPFHYFITHSPLFNPFLLHTCLPPSLSLLLSILNPFIYPIILPGRLVKLACGTVTPICPRSASCHPMSSMSFKSIQSRSVERPIKAGLNVERPIRAGFIPLDSSTRRKTTQNFPVCKRIRLVIVVQ